MPKRKVGRGKQTGSNSYVRRKTQWAMGCERKEAEPSHMLKRGKQYRKMDPMEKVRN